jgi:hypothetical protein
MSSNKCLICLRTAIARCLCFPRGDFVVEAGGLGLSFAYVLTFAAWTCVTIMSSQEMSIYRNGWKTTRRAVNLGGCLGLKTKRGYCHKELLLKRNQVFEYFLFRFLGLPCLLCVKSVRHFHYSWSIYQPAQHCTFLGLVVLS